MVTKAEVEEVKDKSLDTMKKYYLKVMFTEWSLGSSPCDPEVYKKFIASKARDEKINLGEEVETLPADQQEQVGWSVFHKDETGLFYFDYKVRGFLKEAARAVTGKGVTAVHSKIDKWVFVSPRRLYLMNPDGTHVTAPHGTHERPLRAMTMQGPRTSLKRSDYVREGTWFECEVIVLPLGLREFNEDRLRSWFDYGAFNGISEWRTGSFGRFTYEFRLL